MMELLKCTKKFVKNRINKIKNSLIYKFSKQTVELKDLQKEVEKIKNDYLIKERKYIDKINIQKWEIRYIDLQMARVRRYVNSCRFKNDSNEYIREHLIDLIEGNKYE